MGFVPGGTGVMIWVRALWRRRWRSIVGLGVLTGFAFGIPATALAGARRTETSYDRLRQVVHSYDDGIAIDAPGAMPDDPIHDHYSEATVAAIEQLPMVAAHGRAAVYIASLPDTDWEFGLYAPEDGAVGNTIERDRLLRGRRADATKVDEVMVNEAAVSAAHIDVGSVLDLGTLSPAQQLQVMAGDEHAFDNGLLGPELHLRVVGVTRGRADVAGRSDPSIFATPAFDRAYRGRVAYNSRLLLVRRAVGTTTADLEQAVGQLVGEPKLGIFSAADEDVPARNATRTLAVGLLVFALVAMAASILTVGTAVVRHSAATDDDQPVLLSLGLTRPQRVRAIVLASAPIAVLGAVLAVVGMTIASQFMPVGLAHRIEPNPGVQLDVLAALLTIAFVVVVVAVTAGIAGAMSTRRHALDRRQARVSTVAATVARSGAPAVVTTGTRLAFDRRPPALPVRSTLVATSAAVLVIVAALVFGNSLDRLSGAPDRWGVSWDLALDATPDGADQFAQDLRNRDDLAGVGILVGDFVDLGSSGLRAYGLDTTHMGYALRSGAQPLLPDEVVIGPRAARDQHVHLGSTLNVPMCPCGGDAIPTLAPVRVVGIALFPDEDGSNYDNALGFSSQGFADHVGTPTDFRAVVRVAPHHRIADVVTDLRDAYPGQVSKYSFPIQPGTIGNLTTLHRFPVALALYAGLLGLVALVNVLSSTARRRRRELATLRSLGFNRAQASSCIAWQAISVCTVALVIGIPLGGLAGASVWATVSRRVDIATDPLWPVLACATVAIGALVVACGSGLTIGWGAARSRPARALHDE